MEIAYYTEPVLGVDRRGAPRLQSRWEEWEAVCTQSLPKPLPRRHDARFRRRGGALRCDRAAFLSGRWGDEHTSNAPARPLRLGDRRAQAAAPPPGKGAVCARLSAGTKRRRAGWGPCAAARASRYETRIPSAFSPPTPQSTTWSTPGCPSSSRMPACGPVPAFISARAPGDSGDQLQDDCAELLLNPANTRAHLLRCASASLRRGTCFTGGMSWSRGRQACAPVAATTCSGFPTLCMNTSRQREIPEYWRSKSPFWRPASWGRMRQETIFHPRRLSHVGQPDGALPQAVRRVSYGAHGLPLMGSCDWNDGMSNIGREGRGESVWLAQFLAIVEERMAALCRPGGCRPGRELLRAAPKH